jgi:hypothetical protein
MHACPAQNSKLYGHSPLPCHVYRSSSRGRQLTLGRGWSITSRKSCSRRLTPIEGSRELDLEAKLVGAML